MKQAINQIFSLPRWLRVLRIELYQNTQAFFIILAAVLGLSGLVNFLSYDENIFPLHQVFYFGLTLSLGGLIFTSLVFSELHKSGADLRFITLPASNFEKLLAKYSFSSFGYLVGSAFLYFCITGLTSLLSLLIFGKAQPLFNPFNFEGLVGFGVYLVLHSIYLFGAVFYKRLAFALTSLSIILVVFILSLFVGLFFLILNADVFIAHGFLAFTGLTELSPQSENLNLIFQTVSELVFWVVLPPYFWILTYLRIKEKEV